MKGSILLSGVLVASMAIGCASNNSNPPQEQQGKLYGAAGSGLGAGKSVEQDPPLTAQTHFAAGQFAEAQKNYQGAAQQYEKACALQEDYLLAEYRLGVCYAHMKNWPKAIAAWKSYIESTNGDCTAYSNLGFTYELMGDTKNAEDAYKQGIAKNPRSQPCRVNYGLLLARASRVNEAIEQFNTVLKPAEVHYNLASIYEQQGEMQLARSEYETAVKLDPKMIDAQTRLASLRMDDFDE